METRTVKERILDMLRVVPATRDELLAQFDYERQQRGAASVIAYLAKTEQIEPCDGNRLRLTGRAPAKPEPRPKRQAVVEPEQPIQTPQAEPAQPPLEWALWHDGDLLIRRGEVNLVLTPNERKLIGDWLAKVAA